MPSSAWGFERRAAARGEPLDQDLHDKIQAAQVAYADETGWRVDGVNHYLWYFLDHPDVDPTNNHAERALRPSVIFRKITFGNRSQAGARVHGILTSLIQTAILQNVAPQPFLQKLILATSTTAQAALFNDSS